MAELTEAERAVLDFERECPFWRWQGAKENAVRERFGVSLTRYVQRVNALLSDPAAEAYDAQTVRRLRRLRERRVGGVRRAG